MTVREATIVTVETYDEDRGQGMDKAISLSSSYGVAIKDDFGTDQVERATKVIFIHSDYYVIHPSSCSSPNQESGG